MSDKQIISVAVVGGGVGRNHIGGYVALPDRYRFAAICDLNADLANEIAAEHEGTKAVTDLQDVLSDPEIDLVDICLPPHLHCSAAIAVLEAGKDVVCEKPLGTSLAEVAQIEDAAQRTGRKVFPVFQYRFGNGYQRMVHLIETGLAGKPFTASLETHWNRGKAYYDVPWRGTWDGERGGAIVGHAIHIHNLLTYALGNVTSVTGFLETKVNDIETEDCAAISMKTESGALATSSVTLGSAKDMSRMRIVFENVTIESDLLPYEIGSGNWTFTARDPGKQAEIDAAVNSINLEHERYAGFVEHIHNGITGNAKSGTATLAEGRHSIELITALYDASRSGKVVNLPLSADHPLYNGWRPNEGSVG